MSVIDISIAKQHLRVTDRAQDEIIQLYLDGAEQSSALYMQRAIFSDAGSLTSARDAAPAALQTALEGLRAQQTTAEAITDDLERCTSLDSIVGLRSEAIAAYRRTMAGIMITELIQAAALLTLGHLFQNREDNVIGNSLKAIELPTGAKQLLQPYRVGMGV